MISTRAGKDPVRTTRTHVSASDRSAVSTHTPLDRLLHRPALHLRAVLRMARRRRALAVALLAGSATATAAATLTVTAAVHHLQQQSVAPLAQARPVPTAAQALKTQSALAPKIKHHPFADAAKHLRDFAELQRLSDLHPLRGLATWYGSVLHGHKTASGETFDETRMTAAHRTLPLGTVVRVTDLRTLRSVIVRINDRGTLAPGRVIDLSSAAAEELGILRSGTAQVKLEVLRAPDQG